MINEDNKLVIEDLNKLKITSIKRYGDVIHFKYDGKHYTLINGASDMTLVMTLYEGRCRGCLNHIRSQYGMSQGLIKYRYKRKTLNSIDKEHFVMELQVRGFVEYKGCKFRVSRFEHNLLMLLKESSERDKKLTLQAMSRYGYFEYMTIDMDIDEILNKCEVIKDADS